MFKVNLPHLVLWTLLFLAGCQTSAPNTAAPSLTLTPATLKVSAGSGSAIFNASVQNSAETVSWALSGSGTLSAVSGSSTSYTPPTTVAAAQTATLIATLGTTGISASAVITIEPSDPTDPTNPTDPTDPVKTYELLTTLANNGKFIAPGIDCGLGTVDCFEPYAEGETVEVQAQPETGYVLETWTGACEGNSLACTVTMSSDKQVGARFEAE